MRTIHLAGNTIGELILTALLLMLLSKACLGVQMESIQIQHQTDPATINAQEAIQRNLDSMDAALSRKDLKAAFSFYRPTYSHKLFGKTTITLHDERKALAGAINRLKGFTFVNHILYTELDGDTAKVGLVTHDTTKLSSRDGSPPMTIVQSEIQGQHWVRVPNGQWMLESTLTMSRSTNIYRGAKLVSETVMPG